MGKTKNKKATTDEVVETVVETTTQAVEGAAEVTTKEPFVFDINSKFETIEEFMADTVNASTKVENITELQPNQVIVVARTIKKEKVVLVKMVETVQEDHITYKDNIVSEIAEEYHPQTGDTIFVIESSSKTNFAGREPQFKPEANALYALVQEVVTRPDLTCRIGGVFFEDEAFAKTPAAKQLETEIIQKFKNEFGIDVKLQFSKNAGKVQKVEGPGLAILAQNKKQSVPTDLFKAGSHHYRRRTMYAYQIEDDKLVLVNEGDNELKTMLKEAASV